MNFSVDFSSMKYKEVKEYILSIEDIENVFNDGEKENIINRLLQDKRKTVQKLGIKISKILESKEKEIQRVRKMYDFDRSFGDFR